MAPPSNKLKLSALTAEQVALEVASLACEHVARLVMALLSPSYSLRPASRREPAELCRETQVYSTVFDLAEYALRGRGLDAPVQEYLVSLMTLWSSVCGETLDVDGLASESDPQSALGLVVCAALAREAIELGGRVTAAQMAVLAGLSATQVRLLARQSELAMSSGKIAAKDARSWLAARAVPGFSSARRR